jgi:hypothetical protein
MGLGRKEMSCAFLGSTLRRKVCVKLLDNNGNRTSCLDQRRTLPKIVLLAERAQKGEQHERK